MFMHSDGSPYALLVEAPPIVDEAAARHFIMNPNVLNPDDAQINGLKPCLCQGNLDGVVP